LQQDPVRQPGKNVVMRQAVNVLQRGDLVSDVLYEGQDGGFAATLRTQR
jgi:hypothetical protein